MNLFDDSNFDAYDRDRYGPVLHEGLAQHGLQLDDVVLVHQDSGMWVFCQTGLFTANMGMFKKRTEVGPFIPSSDLGSLGTEPSGPHSLRLVVKDRSEKTVAKIDFSPAGPDRDVATEKARCRAAYQTLLQVWSEAPRSRSGGCPCGQGPADIEHFRQHIVEVKAPSGVQALTYDCPVCGIGSELWRNDDEGWGGAPAGLGVHMMIEHGIRD